MGRLGHSRRLGAGRAAEPHRAAAGAPSRSGAAALLLETGVAAQGGGSGSGSGRSVLLRAGAVRSAGRDRLGAIDAGGFHRGDDEPAAGDVHSAALRRRDRPAGREREGDRGCGGDLFVTRRIAFERDGAALRRRGLLLSAGAHAGSRRRALLAGRQRLHTRLLRARTLPHGLGGGQIPAAGVKGSGVRRRGPHLQRGREDAGPRGS
jgi:hypothetical protein